MGVHLSSHITRGVSEVVDHYRGVFHMTCHVLRHQLNYRYTVALYMCFWMGVCGSCGLGLPLIWALTCMRQGLNFLWLKSTLTLPCISMPLGERSVQQKISCGTKPGVRQACATMKRPRCIGKENACEGENIPPSKRGRKSKHISDKHKCGSCTVWLQTGSNEKLLEYHNMSRGRVRHPGDKAVEFSMFLSCNGVHNIILRPDSCMCDACYRDCLRGEGKPRWIGLSKSLICKHCFICCPGTEGCSCECITQWGPTQQFHENEHELWHNYFQCKSKVQSGSNNYDVCKVHFTHMNRVAIMCARFVNVTTIHAVHGY